MIVAQLAGSLVIKDKFASDLFFKVKIKNLFSIKAALIKWFLSVEDFTAFFLGLTYVFKLSFWMVSKELWDINSYFHVIFGREDVKGELGKTF